MLKTLFKRTFDIRDGEIRISFFMQLYIFLLITVLLMVKPTVNALFLSALGADHLPYGYVLVAVIAMVVSYFYNKGVQRFSLRKITIATLVFFSLSFATLSLLMYSRIVNDWVLYFYYLSVSIFAVLVTSQFWIIANMVYNAREAKRLFGFIGAGAIAGGIFGGYVTSIIASAYGNKIVIALAALLILCCIPILQTVWNIRVDKLNTFVRKKRITGEAKSYSSPYKLIIQSKHLTYLAAIVGTGVVMAKLVDFQFSAFAHQAIPNSDGLASFFGFWFSTFNVIALLIQLFLTNRMLAWFGVTTNLLILPLGIAIGCLLFLTFPELWVLVLIKGMDGSFKQSINKAGIELSILPIPFHIKKEAKSYIDVVVDSIATGLAGLLLIFVIRRLDLSPSYVTVIILLFLFIWMVLIYKLREAYFESFRSNIQNALVGTSVTTKKLAFKTTSKSTHSILSKGSETEILNLLDKLENFKLQTFQPQIVNLLRHESSKVKAAAIKQLRNYKKGTAVLHIKDLIHTKDDDVVYAAMDYLLHHTYIKGDKLFNSYLDHPTDYISNAAVLCLAKEAASNQKLAVKYDLEKRLDAKIRELFLADNSLRKQEVAVMLLAVGYAKIPKFFSFISANFNNKDPYIVTHAIKASGLSSYEPFITNLLEFLPQSEFRKDAREALRSYGVAIADKLLQMDLSESIKDDVKPFIPKVIESFKSRESLKVLVRLLRSKDFVIRLEAAKSLNMLKIQNPSISIDQRQLTRVLLKEGVFYRNTINAIATLQHTTDAVEKAKELSDQSTELLIAREHLIDILLLQLDESLECVFKLLSLKYNQADVDTAYYGLKSDSKDTRVNAVEFLDNLLKSKLKKNILPLIEHHVLEHSTDTPALLRSKIKSEKHILLGLLKNRGTFVKLAVLNVIKYSEDASYVPSLIPYTKHQNKKLNRFAETIIQVLQKKPIAQ